jgi:hypothetical protein
MTLVSIEEDPFLYRFPGYFQEEAHITYAWSSRNKLKDFLVQIRTNAREG